MSCRERRERWEHRGCRSEIIKPKDFSPESLYESRYPGRRVCHGEGGVYCIGAKKEIEETAERQGLILGPYFPEQPTGMESIYHLLPLINALQKRANEIGPEEHLKELKRKAGLK